MDAKKVATVEDLLSIPEEHRAELINGELIDHGQPSFRHGQTQRSLGVVLDPFCSKGGRDRQGGGWWIVTEAGVCYSTHTACRHDLAGWRRTRLPVPSDDEYVSMAPDWVCEIVSPSSRRYDHIEKPAVYAKQGVGHYWIIDPEAQMLEAFQLENGRWLRIGGYSQAEKVRIPPFDVAEIDLALLWAPSSHSHD